MVLIAEAQIIEDVDCNECVTKEELKKHIDTLKKEILSILGVDIENLRRNISTLDDSLLKANLFTDELSYRLKTNN